MNDGPVAPAVPNPDATAPPTLGETNPQELVKLVMSPDEVKTWWDEINASRARIKTREVKWDVLMKEYIPTVTASAEAETVNTNAHFRNTHTKLASLFQRVPDLTLEALAPLKDPVGMDILGRAITAEDAALIKKQVLNKKLGRDGVDTVRLMDEVGFDVLQWAGIAAVKIGFRSVVRNIPRPRMVPAPAPAPETLGSPSPGSILGLSGAGAAPSGMIPAVDPMTGEPIVDQVPVPIFEEWYIRRMSPKKALLPSDLASGRIDEDASWVGMEFYMKPHEASNAFGITIENGTAEDDRVYAHPDDSGGDVKAKGAKKIHGVEIWFKAAEHPLISEAGVVHHPQALRQLVLLEEGTFKDAPVMLRESPDQTFDEMGQLTPDSLIGFPIEFLHIRDIADSPYPPSDGAFTNSLIKQMNMSRKQSIQIRDAATGKYLYDEELFTPDEIANIKAGRVGQFVAVKAGALANGADKVIAPMSQIAAGRDDYRTAVQIKQDMEETLGIGGAQAGVVQDQKRTATENTIAENKSQARIGKDQQRMVNFFLKCVRKYDTLLQRYMSNNEYIKIIGRDGLTRMTSWNQKVIAGPYAYDIKMDSQLSTDIARQRQQTTNLYAALRPDPLVNPQPLLKKMALENGLDPKELIVDPAVAQMVALAGAGTESENLAGAPPGTAEGGKGGPAPGEPAKSAAPHEATKTGGLPNAPTPGRMPNTPGPVQR